MKYTHKLQFITIHRRKKIPQSFIEIAKEGLRINKKYFSIKKPFNVYICDNYEDFAKHSKLPPIQVKGTSGCVQKEGDVAIKSPQEIAQIKHGKRSQFKSVLTHEINHSLWKQHIATWSPHWLCEGIANTACNSFV